MQAYVSGKKQECSAMNYYEAIRARKSIRKYNFMPLPEETLECLMEYTKKAIPLKKEIGVDFKLLRETDKEKGLQGMFRVRAPYYLLLTSELKQDYLQNAGYLMEQIVLYLTMRGIGTCYQGSVKPGIELKEELKYDYVIAVAFGEPAEELYRQGKRKSMLPEETTVIYREEPGAVVREILQSALTAPSALNVQPWRIVAYHNRLHIFCRKGWFYRDVPSDMQLIDMGIFLATLKLAAEELWMDAHFVWLPQVAEKKMNRNEYITSVILEENTF